MSIKTNYRVQHAHLITRPTDIPTAKNAALDLSTMDEMRRNGIPIALAPDVNDYYEGSEDATFNLPFDSRRGVDINDVWNMSKTAAKAFERVDAREVNFNSSKNG